MCIRDRLSGDAAPATRQSATAVTAAEAPTGGPAPSNATVSVAVNVEAGSGLISDAPPIPNLYDDTADTNPEGDVADATIEWLPAVFGTDTPILATVGSPDCVMLTTWVVPPSMLYEILLSLIHI